MTSGKLCAYYKGERVSNMKKLFVLIIALFLTGGGLVATVASYPVSVNGETLNVTVLNQNGTTYLPLKAVGQALGADVKWTGKSVEIQTVDIEELKKACVMIYADDGKTVMQGSGVYIDYDQVLTANHVVDARTNIKESGGDVLTLEDADVKTDSAVLQSSKGVKPVKIGDSDETKVGDKVILITSPKGKKNTVTYAEILTSGNPNEFIVKSDDLLNGSSGGAMFNMNGELIGIFNSGAGQWKFVIPINLIRKAL